VEQIEKLRQMIHDAKRIVFLGGAGVSTESGIPDFRSENGVFAAIKQYGYPPETLLSHDFFLRYTEIFFEYYKKTLIYQDAQPNQAHIALAKLEQQGKLTAVITQNIDGLHQKAGSKNVLELHGSVYRNHCKRFRCKKEYSLEEVLAKDGVPICDACGGVIKPDVVLYGEGLDEQVLMDSVEHIQKADMMIVGGTSLAVYPAAGLVDYFQGNNLVLINKGETSRSVRAALEIRAPIGEVLGQAVLSDL